MARKKIDVLTFLWLSSRSQSLSVVFETAQPYPLWSYLNLFELGGMKSRRCVFPFQEIVNFIILLSNVFISTLLLKDISQGSAGFELPGIHIYYLYSFVIRWIFIFYSCIFFRFIFHVLDYSKLYLFSFFFLLHLCDHLYDYFIFH